MSGTRHRLIAALSVALQLALSSGLGADLVFCTEESGRVAVESAYDAECCDAHVLPAGARRLGATDDCGCVDMPVLQSLGEARQRLAYAAPSPQALTFPSSDLAPLPPRSGGAPAFRSAVPQRAVSDRRSVVLLV